MPADLLVARLSERILLPWLQVRRLDLSAHGLKSEGSVDYIIRARGVTRLVLCFEGLRGGDLVRLLRDHRHREWIKGVLSLRLGPLVSHFLVHHLFEDLLLLNRIVLFARLLLIVGLGLSSFH